MAQGTPTAWTDAAHLSGRCRCAWLRKVSCDGSLACEPWRGRAILFVHHFCSPSRYCYKSARTTKKNLLKKNHLCTRSLKRRIDVHNGADTHLNLFLFHFFFLPSFLFLSPIHSPPSLQKHLFLGKPRTIFFHSVPKTSQHTPTDR